MMTNQMAIQMTIQTAARQQRMPRTRAVSRAAKAAACYQFAMQRKNVQAPYSVAAVGPKLLYMEDTPWW